MLSADWYSFSDTVECMNKTISNFNTKLLDVHLPIRYIKINLNNKLLFAWFDEVNAIQKQSKINVSIGHLDLRCWLSYNL